MNKKDTFQSPSHYYSKPSCKTNKNTTSSKNSTKYATTAESSKQLTENPKTSDKPSPKPRNTLSHQITKDPNQQDEVKSVISVSSCTTTNSLAEVSPCPSLPQPSQTPTKPRPSTHSDQPASYTEPRTRMKLRVGKEFHPKHKLSAKSHQLSITFLLPGTQTHSDICFKVWESDREEAETMKSTVQYAHGVLDQLCVRDQNGKWYKVQIDMQAQLSQVFTQVCYILSICIVTHHLCSTV